MNIIKLLQGSPEWHSFRANHFTASDAAAMLGFSPYKTRDQLLHEKATGLTEEITEEKQRLFDKGHAAEAMARAILEEDIGQDLFPVTGTSSEWPLIAASLDGLTMDDSMVFEHKLYSQKLVDYIEEHDDLPDSHWPQVEQQLYVSGAGGCKFVVSDGTAGNWFQFDYVRQHGRIEQVLAGWKQFEADLKNYQVPEVKPQAVAEEVTALPAVSMVVTGQISVVDNFAVFEKGLTAFLQDKLIREPKTDNDFATLDLQIKALKKAEEMLKAAGDSVLAQVEAVDTAMKKKDSLAKLVRDNRLMAEKLLAAEKDRRRMEIQQAAAAAIQAFMVDLSDEVGIRIPAPAADIAEAMKGKKTIASLQSAANDEVARAKIEARRMADNVKENVQILGSMCSAEIKGLLFPDLETLATKPADDFKAIAQGRVIQHEQQLREREEMARRKAEAEAQAKAEAEARRIEEEARRMSEAETKAAEQQPAPALADIPLTTGAAIKAKAQPRTLGDALTHFGMQKNLGDQDIQELLDIVAHYANLNAKAA